MEPREGGTGFQSLAVMIVTISDLHDRCSLYLPWLVSLANSANHIATLIEFINFAPTASHPAHDQQISPARVPHSPTSSSFHPYSSLPTSTSQQVTHIASELSSHHYPGYLSPLIRLYPTTFISLLRLESEPYSTSTAHITQLFSLVS